MSHEGHEVNPVGHVFGPGAFVMEDHQRLSTATATSDCRLDVLGFRNTVKTRFSGVMEMSVD